MQVTNVKASENPQVLMQVCIDCSCYKLSVGGTASCNNIRIDYIPMNRHFETSGCEKSFSISFECKIAEAKHLEPL